MLVEQPLSDHFRGFAAVAERDGGTTYAAICRGVADDDGVLSLLDGAALPQRRPLILLAAVHYLLLAGAEHPLAASYDTVTAVAAARSTGGVTAGPPEADDVAAAFADFCRAHRAEVEQLIATRATQTNEVGRCTALLPGLCHIASQYRWEVPISLLDLGTSAGLNLLFDDYAYTYVAAHGGASLTAGRCGVGRRPRMLRPRRPHPPARAAHPDDGGPGRPGPLAARSVLRRRRPVAAGLPVAGQPGALRPPARRAGQRRAPRRTRLGSSAATW